MIDPAFEFAFAGSAFLNPEPARLLELSRELGDPVVTAALDAAPGTIEPEYNRLFLNPAGSPCSLWQSAHCGEQHLMGEPHLGALEWYRRFGVEPATTSDPADHAGLLLLFFARLLASGAPPEEQAAFAAAHLAWLPAFCETVLAETRHPFFRLLAERTRDLAAGYCPESEEEARI